MRAQGLQRSHNKGEILPPHLGLGSHQAPQRTGEGQQERRVNSCLEARTQAAPRGGRAPRVQDTREAQTHPGDLRRPEARSPSPSWRPQSDTVSQQKRALGPRRVGTGRAMGKGPGQLSVPSGLSPRAPRLPLPQEKQPNPQPTFLPTSVGAILPRRLGRQLPVLGVPVLGSEPAAVGLCGDSGPLPGRVPRPEPRGEGLLTPARLALLLRGRRGAGYPGSLMDATGCRCGCSRPSCPPSAASAVGPGAGAWLFQTQPASCVGPSPEASQLSY